MAWKSVDNAVGGASSIFQDAGHGLMRTVGGWGNFAGPSVFMIRTMLAGTTSAITMGLTGAGLASGIFGTATLPFLICACFGFIFGSVGFYRNALQRSIIALRRYPQLMRLHLDANYPSKEFRRMPKVELDRAIDEHWTMQSMLITSWLTAEPALDSMLETQEQAITMDSGNSNLVEVEVQDA